MAAVKSVHGVDELLLTVPLFFVFISLLTVLSLFVENLYTVFDGVAPKVTLLGLPPPGTRQVTLFELAGYNIIPSLLLSPALHLPPTGADTRSCFIRRSLGILERCPRKQSKPSKN